MKLPCNKCAGEGAIYKSRHGGNDPDVWRDRTCEACKGSGSQACEARGCSEPAVAFNDDGEALCEDCMAEWVCEAQ
jgi:DnaJ-class molecular chaperone